MMNRREIITSAALASGAAMLNRFAASSASAADQPSTQLSADYTPVYTPNGATLDWKLVDGVKIMHLIAEPVEHEMAPGLKVQCWSYNGRTPGPTIEAVQGDRLRIYVTNRLPEGTTIHWHGLIIPNGMDGVNGLTQEPIPPGGTFKYEFTVNDAGTFMYHPHLDEMTQQSLGMMGMFVVHPSDPSVRESHRVDRDYCIMLSEWRIDPGTSRPVTTEMTEFNILTMNSKAYPGTQPLVAKLGEKVRVRFGNLSAMDHHPIHLHGMQMVQTETDGGIIPESARYSMNTVLVPVGSTRAVEFMAQNPGDWPMHCHMTHHVMNQMGHKVPNLLGVNGKALDDSVGSILPAYMSMGTQGMADMMAMAVPKNSIPMLGGKCQFGDLDMGGMFTILKIRDHISGYEDPGDYQFPPGTRAIAATAQELRRDGIL